MRKHAIARFHRRSRISMAIATILPAALALALAPSIGTHGLAASTFTAGSGIELEVTLSINPLDPPSGYDPCGTATSLTAYTGENVRGCYRITNLGSAPAHPTQPAKRWRRDDPQRLSLQSGCRGDGLSQAH